MQQTSDAAPAPVSVTGFTMAQAMHTIMDVNATVYVASSTSIAPHARFLPGRNDHKTAQPH
ncbi:hypothetical protein ZWY2020_042356 [Hordeum vulgare]|nr:hypothetical protein ZWY2020_042356 [Hordeum vulgare]